MKNRIFAAVLAVVLACFTAAGADINIKYITKAGVVKTNDTVLGVTNSTTSRLFYLYEIFGVQNLAISNASLINVTGGGGRIDFVETNSTPTPASGTLSIYADSTTHNLASINSSGTIKLLGKSKSYIQLTGFMNGTGALPLNTNDYTLTTFMRPVFLNGTAATANFVQWYIQVPTDFDTSVDPKIKITDKLTNADTGVRRYVASMACPANSAAYAASVGTSINVDIAADASGASGDVEQSSQVTLTGWGAALTAGRLWIIQIGRDGNSGTDTSTVDSMFSSAEIEYGSTQ